MWATDWASERTTHSGFNDAPRRGLVAMVEMISIRFGSNEREEKSAAIEIQGFGKIARAKITLSPLTVFVGKNNTGKSYAAYILWAVWSGLIGLSRSQREKIRAPGWFKNAITAAENGDRSAIKIEGRRVSAHYNRWIAQKKDAIARSILNYESASIGRLKFTIPGEIYLFRQDRPPKWVRSATARSAEISPWAFSWTNQFENKNTSGEMLGSLGEDDLADLLYRTAIEKLITGDINAMWERATYLPAARTGLVLALNELAASSIQRFRGASASDDVTAARFTTPMIDFLSDLVSTAREGGHARFEEVADFLEKEVYQGSLEIDGSGTPEFTYVTRDNSARLPMHAVSSMISETTPIVALLKRGRVGDALIVEEPEAHLHLAAQRVMARVLVRLVNQGLSTAITTHSDTFIQQINILLRLSKFVDNDEKLRKLNYTTSDVLRENDILVYEFLQTAEGTVVVPAERTNDGFVVKSINDTLYDIFNEIMVVEDRNEQ